MQKVRNELSLEMSLRQDPLRLNLRSSICYSGKLVASHQASYQVACVTLQQQVEATLTQHLPKVDHKQQCILSLHAHHQPLCQKPRAQSICSLPFYICDKLWDLGY